MAGWVRSVPARLFVERKGAMLERALQGREVAIEVWVIEAYMSQRFLANPIFSDRGVADISAKYVLFRPRPFASPTRAAFAVVFVL